MRSLLIMVVLAVCASSSYAVPSVTLSGGGTNLIANAIASLDTTGTITITDSGEYVESNGISFNGKSVNIVAAAGVSPTITNGDNTTTTLVFFLNNCAGSKIGSLDGGRINILYKTHATPGTNGATSVVRFRHTQYTSVTLENVSIAETGTGIPVTAITHDGGSGTRHNTVYLSHVDIDVKCSGTLSTSNSYAYGISAGPANGGGSPVYSNETWNLDHVRIKNYGVAGIDIRDQSCTFNMSYVDVGTLGERINSSTWYPYSTIYNRYGNVPWIGRIDHSIFRAPYGNANLQIAGIGATPSPTWGTSVTLSRCVLLSKMTDTAVNGNLFLGTHQTANLPAGGRTANVTIDHCDLVDVSTVDHTVHASIYRAANAVAGTSHTLTVTNSNIYSLNNRAVNILVNDATHPFTMASSYNNVYGNAAKANVGYTAGTGDISYDPIYADASSGDMRYSNNTVKTGDSAHGAIGVNADYTDPVTAITLGEAGVAVNRAHGWTMLK